MKSIAYIIIFLACAFNCFAYALVVSENGGNFIYTNETERNKFRYALIDDGQECLISEMNRSYRNYSNVIHLSCHIVFNDTEERIWQDLAIIFDSLHENINLSYPMITTQNETQFNCTQCSFLCERDSTGGCTVFGLPHKEEAGYCRNVSNLGVLKNYIGGPHLGTTNYIDLKGVNFHGVYSEECIDEFEHYFDHTCYACPNSSFNTFNSTDKSCHKVSTGEYDYSIPRTQGGFLRNFFCNGSQYFTNYLNAHYAGHAYPAATWAKGAVSYLEKLSHINVFSTDNSQTGGYIVDEIEYYEQDNYETDYCFVPAPSLIWHTTFFDSWFKCGTYWAYGFIANVRANIVDSISDTFEGNGFWADVQVNNSFSINYESKNSSGDSIYIHYSLFDSTGREYSGYSNNLTEIIQTEQYYYDGSGFDYTNYMPLVANISNSSYVNIENQQWDLTYKNQGLLPLIRLIKYGAIVKYVDSENILHLDKDSQQIFGK